MNLLGVPTSPRTWALTTVMVGPRGLGPTRRRGLVPPELVNQVARGMLSVGVKGEEASDIGNPKQ